MSNGIVYADTLIRHLNLSDDANRLLLDIAYATFYFGDFIITPSVADSAQVLADHNWQNEGELITLNNIRGEVHAWLTHYAQKVLDEAGVNL